MELQNHIKFSPTRTKLLDIYPEGSEVSREEICNAYILLSPSMARIKKKRGKGLGKRRISIPSSRRVRGVRFFKEMVKEGYWTSKD